MAILDSLQVSRLKTLDNRKNPLTSKHMQPLYLEAATHL